MFICGSCAVSQEGRLNDPTRQPAVLGEQFVAENLDDRPVRSTAWFVAMQRQDPASATTPKRRCVAADTKRHEVVRKVIRILVGSISPILAHRIAGNDVPGAAGWEIPRLELALWRALTESVKKWRRKMPCPG
jgi:hypothetical protein